MKWKQQTAAAQCGVVGESTTRAVSPWRVLLNVLLLVCLFALLACLSLPLPIFKLFVKPFERGFYCDDDSIRYPYKESSISWVLLPSLPWVFAVELIVLLEMVRVLIENRQPQYFSRSPFDGNRLGSVQLHRIVVRLNVIIGFFVFGAVVQQLTVDLAKYSVGRLRPHFIAVCNSSRLESVCGAGNASAVHVYVDPADCTGDPAMVEYARLSFPSGRSSFSFYCVAFFMLYTETLVFWQDSYAKPILQLLGVAFAALIALSRVYDDKNHWSDVLSGTLIGTSIAAVNVRARLTLSTLHACLQALFVARLFEKRESPSANFSALTVNEIVQDGKQPHLIKEQLL